MLGIPARDFSQSELKKAFRRASIKYHPDKNPDKDTTEQFIEVNNAQNVIMKPEPRYAYDVYAQTKFDQEETIMKGLEAQEMSEEERSKMYWHIINNKRMFETLLQIVPYYLAWVFSILLLVDVSISFKLHPIFTAN